MEKPPPGTGDGRDVNPIGDAANGRLEIYLRESVLKEIVAHAKSARDKSIGGLLVGSQEDYEGRAYIEIEAFVPGPRTGAEREEFDFTDETWSRLDELRETWWPDSMLVGWMRTHPGSTALTPDDVAAFRRYFGDPWMVACVVDALRGSLEFHRWSEGRLVECGFFLVHSEEAAPPRPPKLR